jgi:Trehalose utilisation
LDLAPLIEPLPHLLDPCRRWLGAEQLPHPCAGFRLGPLLRELFLDSDYQRPPFPIAWARKENNGRVYFNAMGHRDDVSMSERFRQMVAGAVAWTLGAEDAALTANMSWVTPHTSVIPPER